MDDRVLSSAPPHNAGEAAVLDITRDVCPMTFVRTLLALHRLMRGSLLLVRMRGE